MRRAIEETDRRRIKQVAHRQMKKQKINEARP